MHGTPQDSTPRPPWYIDSSHTGWDFPPEVPKGPVRGSALPVAPTALHAAQRELARAAGQPVLVDFYADWCVTCKELEAFTFSDPEVQKRMRSFVLLKADVTQTDAADRQLLESLGLFGPPAILFYDASGTELRAFRTVSYVPSDEFAERLDDVLDFAN